MTYSVYSFDVYDTCLVRVFASPSDLFFDLAKRVFSRGGCNWGMLDVERFVRGRKEAERKARRISLTEKEDVTLEEIYGCFTDLKRWGVDSKVAMEEEVELEASCIRPIETTRDYIDSLRREGRRIIFVSDMYLPAGFISEMLFRYGYMKHSDSLYVSSEIGLLKRTGNLFKYILETERVSPSDIVHMGDNNISDVAVPTTMGIKTIRFEQADLTRYEMRISQLSKRRLYARKNREYSAKIAGISRIIRNRTSLNKTVDADFISIVSGVIAPFLVTFVLWFLRDARERNIDRLYFLSRDAQILLKIARVFKRYIEIPECCYLYGSRRAWYLPSLMDDQGNIDLRLVVNPNESTSPRDILERMGLQPDEFISYLKKSGFINALDLQMGPQDFLDFWYLLDKLTPIIHEKSTNAKRIALDYFAQEGLLSESRWAIVDSGWRLSSQYALKRILSSGGCADIQGYYIGVSRDRYPDVGDYRALISWNNEHALLGGGPYRWFLKRAVMRVIESVFMIADHPTVTGYVRESERVVPVFSTSRREGEIPAREIHDVILNYAEEFCATFLTDDSMLRDDVVRSLVMVSLSGLKDFFRNPDTSSATQFLGIRVFSDPNDSGFSGRNVVDMLTLGDVGSMILGTLGFRHPHGLQQPLWVEGSAALSPAHVRYLVKFLMSMKRLLS